MKTRKTRTKVTLHRFRKSRYQSKSLRILAKARSAVADTASREKDRPAKADEFFQLCDTMLPESR